MADYHCPTTNDAMRLIAEAAVNDASFCRPGFIEEFDPQTNLAKVTPAIRAKTSIKGKVKYVKLPMIIRVPVVVPYGQIAGLCLTVPIKKGDECLLVFSDVFLDNFVKEGAKGGECVAPECCGGDNETSHLRMHSITDAICIPGIISQPKAIPNWNTEALELRTRDGKNFVRVGTGDYGIRLTSGGGYDQGGSDIRMKDGKIWFYGAEEINTRTPMKWAEEPPTSSGGTREPTMPD